MRPENKRMQEFLRKNGIKARVKYFSAGSMKFTWRLYNPEIPWTRELGFKLEDLGFLNYDNKPFSPYAGNGGVLSVSVRGHNELLKGGE